MKRTIPDWLDGYDGNLSFPEPETVNPERIRRLTMRKLGRRCVPVGALIAVCAALALTATAGAVGYTLWDSARADLGLTASIPEYTEYEITAPPEQTADAAVSALETGEDSAEDETAETDTSVQLVSALCAGRALTAYLSVSPVTEETAALSWDEAQGLYDFAVWDASCETDETASGTAVTLSVTQVEYDAGTGTVLLKLEAEGEFFETASSFGCHISWHAEQGGEVTELDFGTVTIPITQARERGTTLALDVPNQYLPEIPGTLTKAVLWADHLTLTLEREALSSIIARMGEEEAYAYIGNRVENPRNQAAGLAPQTELTFTDADCCYEDSWYEAITALLTDAKLVFADGSTQAVDYGEYAGPIQEADPDTEDSTDAASESFTAYFSAPVDVSEVTGLEIGGTVYPLEDWTEE